MRTAGLKTMLSDDSNMTAMGLGVGLGGFAGLVRFTPLETVSSDIHHSS